MFATTYFFKCIWLLVVVSALYCEVGILSVALLHLVLSCHHLTSVTWKFCPDFYLQCVIILCPKPSRPADYFWLATHCVYMFCCRGLVGFGSSDTPLVPSTALTPQSAGFSYFHILMTINICC